MLVLVQLSGFAKDVAMTKPANDKPDLMDIWFFKFK